MPVAKSLAKVTKNLQNSRGQIHPKGRKFKQLARATLRDQKLQVSKIKATEKRQNELLVVKFLQEALTTRPQTAFTLEDMKLFIDAYLSRDDEVLVTLRAERRPGRPAGARLQILEEKVKYEKLLFETGYKIPDLSNPDVVKRLREWNGTSGGASIFQWIHVAKGMKELPVKKDVAME
ncbi:hypothetical protein BABINDRAFT_31337 [Babjeviella inositovora NRRL Y-12698]|uniref:Translation machinery-associated protein 16 n=1 Tax=Babjeviella inositovora NRRL Y-12698 TaxID=984486 RepID=A0A1E3QZU7_9ASCO|nr:uncharacterized protein BABINDRAFT_31337 [Babjeviella inositovora NRRL Y-12698]ODQ82602.1 hypothetical protein BABINDRAFT_31337 [Babjeviella inositovora NRRL Y-12698]